MRAARARAVTNCGYEHLRDVLVPDGQGSTLHVDFLLLTARGLVVIDLRDIEGNIFGGDQMTEWTVMHRALRYTFPNPQTGLYDRIAAVRALAPELPIEGRAVFTSSGQFPKGSAAPHADARFPVGGISGLGPTGHERIAGALDAVLAPDREDGNAQQARLAESCNLA